MEGKLYFLQLVKEFNTVMGKESSNRTEPSLGTENDHNFVYNFILEELNEYIEACKEGNIVEIADALGDIMYVLCNGILIHGLQDKFVDIYNEIQASNMSKVCKTEEEAIKTAEIRSDQQGTPCHYEQVGEYYVVKRTSDNKVMKSISYFSPNLEQFLVK
jgi:hypothetical protein